MPYKRFLGFEKGPDGLPKVVESQADVVRLIFSLFIEGKTPSGIAVYLKDAKIPTPCGKRKWSGDGVKSILTNEKYRGSALLQKTYTPDFLTKEKKINDGTVQQYYIEHSHEAIVPPEVFDLVQLEIQKRGSDTRRRTSVSCFSNKLVCAECGSFYGRKVWHSNSKYKRFIWQCSHKFKDGKKCSTPHLYEDEIKTACISVLNGVIDNRVEILQGLSDAISKLTDMETCDAKIAKIEKATHAISAEMRREIEQNARQAQDQREYTARYRALDRKLTAVNAERQKLLDGQAERQDRHRKLAAYMEKLQLREGLLDSFEEGLWVGLVEEVQVHADGRLVFRLQDGSERVYG